MAEEDEVTEELNEEEPKEQEGKKKKERDSKVEAEGKRYDGGDIPR